MATVLMFAASVCAYAGDGRFVKDNVKQNVRTPLAKTIKKNGLATVHNLTSPFKAMTSSDILIEEDFSKFTVGSENAPDGSLIASRYENPGIEINPSLTKLPGWWGDWVYQAGGCCAIMCPDYQSMGYLATPLGDYSGDVTVTLRAKAYPCELTGTTLMVAAYTGGADNPVYANVDGSPDECNVRLYPEQGWSEITYTLRNLSADPDGFIAFGATGYVLIDDIKVTTTANFIAAPVMLPLTDTRQDGFTINWNPVRKAFNYHINLYQKVYESVGDKETVVDFEDGMPDSGWAFPAGKTVEDGIGADGSKGLRLYNGDVITTPVSASVLRNLEAWIMAYGVQENGKVRIEAFDGEEWMSFGKLYLSFFLPEEGSLPLDLQVDGDGVFANRFKAVRLTFDDMDEGDYAVIDDIVLTEAPVSKLVMLDNPDEEEGYPGYYWSRVNAGAPTSYTFSNLDPEGEYYYSVRSHYVNYYSENEPVLAFYVAAPEVEKATGITADSYTSHWSEVLKADSYTLRNFGVNVAEEAGEQTILKETFSKTGEYTGNDNPWEGESLMNSFNEESLDMLTDASGWAGLGNTFCKGMVGCSDAMWESTYLKTPVLDMSNSGTAMFRIKAYGYVGTMLGISDGRGQLYLLEYEPVDAENDRGIIDGYYEIPFTGSKSLRLIDYNMNPFMVDEFYVTQDVPKGAVIRTLVGTAAADKGETSYTWNNLAATGFTRFCYDVESHYSLDGNTTHSDPSKQNFVDTVNGTSVVKKLDVEPREIRARYNMLGQKVGADVRGMQIILYSDGTSEKVFVK